ncbi:hypothetical protein PJI17_31985, partial [Mycobacterium kansasii]
YILTFPKVSLKIPQFFPCFLAFPVISDIIGDIDLVSVSLASETCSDTDTSNTGPVVIQTQLDPSQLILIGSQRLKSKPNPVT